MQGEGLHLQGLKLRPTCCGAERLLSTLLSRQLGFSAVNESQKMIQQTSG